MEIQTTMAEQGNGPSLRFRVAGYVGFFLFIFTIFLIVTFPYDLLLKGLMSRAKTDLPVPINFKTLSPRFPLGLKATGIVLGPFSKGDTKVIEIDSLHARSSLFKALKKQVDGYAEARLYGGKILLDYTGNDIAGDGEIRVVSMEINPLLAFVNDIPWEIAGEVGGKGKIHFDRLKPGENSGKFKLNSTNLKLSQVNLMITKADFDFSKAEAEIELKKGGILKVNSLNLEGKPCGFEITGQISLNYTSFLDSRLDLDVIFHPSPNFKDKIPFDMLKKNDKGLHIGKLRGTFNEPRFP